MPRKKAVHDERPRLTGDLRLALLCAARSPHQENEWIVLGFSGWVVKIRWRDEWPAERVEALARNIVALLDAEGPLP